MWLFLSSFLLFLLVLYPHSKRDSRAEASGAFILPNPLLIRELPGVFLAGIQQALEELTPLRREILDRASCSGKTEVVFTL
jgi:hypothetical protein